MFRFGQWELVIALVLIFILFGHRLPSVMRLLGRGAIQFHDEPNTPRPTSLADWLVMLMLVSLMLLTLLWPAIVRI